MITDAARDQIRRFLTYGRGRASEGTETVIDEMVAHAEAAEDRWLRVARLSSVSGDWLDTLEVDRTDDDGEGEPDARGMLPLRSIASAEGATANTVIVVAAIPDRRRAEYRMGSTDFARAIGSHQGRAHI